VSEPSGPSKVNPETLNLKAAPRRAVRFKRNLLIGIVGVGCVGIFGVAWLALRGPGLRVASSADELYTAGRNATPDGLAGLPRDYSQIPKSKQQLGPPLPGDLGPPIVERERELGVNPTGPNAEDEAARAERLRLAQQAQQAREAGVFFELNQRTGNVTAASAPPGAPATTASNSPAAPDAVAPHLNLDLDRDQNDQQRKTDFINQAAARSIYNDHALQTPASPYEVLAGTVISASLLTGLDSDLPGMVTAQITEDVHDSVSGRILLIPHGSRLIGGYDSVIAFGQSRALLVWRRIVMPDGSSIQIDNLPATDAAGYAGLEDQVDYHTWTLLRGIAMSTLLGVGTQVTFGNGQSNLVQAIQQSTQESANQAGQRIVEKDINIQPTIMVRPGWPLRVIVHKDFILRPYQG
jgi:type IV secretory pathway VirB10-like protein